MQRCYVLLALAAAMGSIHADAVELAKIPRTIDKQPVYQSKSPKYCLLVFGSQAETRVWLVVDGNSAYIDRNANGDLTEEGERVSSDDCKSFHLGNITEPGGATHKDLQLWVHDRSQFSLTIDTAKEGRKVVGQTSFRSYWFPKPQFGDQPQNAPIIHSNGPISVVPYVEATVIPRELKGNYREEWLRLTVGSPGLGVGTAAISEKKHTMCNGAESVRAVLAEIEFPRRDQQSGSIKSRQPLTAYG